jgi:hypothetical protein
MGRNWNEVAKIHAKVNKKRDGVLKRTMTASWSFFIFYFSGISIIETSSK